MPSLSAVASTPCRAFVSSLAGRRAGLCLNSGTAGVLAANEEATKAMEGTVLRVPCHPPAYSESMPAARTAAERPRALFCFLAVLC